MAESEAPAPSLRRCGEHARALIAARLARLVALQAEVLADRDPEPLHQMRVSFRRLRGILEQFGPALVLPDAADPARIARISRRLGLSRDLDVLRQRLDQQLIPLLSEREVQALKPLFKQLRRERRLAFEELTEALQGRRYLKLLAQLQAWIKAPRFTPLGEEPLALWGSELLQAVTTGLTMEPGWWVESPHGTQAAADLHRLRRRIKRARYGLSHLEPLAPAAVAVWVAGLRRMQEHLGDLNDVQLIETALHHALDAPPDQVVPGLCSVLMEQRGKSWQLWRDQVAQLHQPAARTTLYGLLAPLGPGTASALT